MNVAIGFVNQSPRVFAGYCPSEPEGTDLEESNLVYTHGT